MHLKPSTSACSAQRGRATVQYPPRVEVTLPLAAPSDNPGSSGQPCQHGPLPPPEPRASTASRLGGSRGQSANSAEDCRPLPNGGPPATAWEGHRSRGVLACPIRHGRGAEAPAHVRRRPWSVKQRAGGERTVRCDARSRLATTERSVHVCLSCAESPLPRQPWRQLARLFGDLLHGGQELRDPHQDAVLPSPRCWHAWMIVRRASREIE